ncbi:hypothetical protein GCM10027615_28690 [Plantactinospora veratri]
MTREDGPYLIRPGRARDAIELARLHAAVQLQAVTGGQPHPGIAAWVEDLLDGGHPSVVPDDFLVAEDQATGRPVASLVGLRQDWSLAGVRLPVAQIELVGTAPEHRGNRLTERLFAALHQRYAADGVPVQMIEESRTSTGGSATTMPWPTTALQGCPPPRCRSAKRTGRTPPPAA